MNYSTLKKTVVLSAVSLMAIGFASAQGTTTTTTTKSDSTTAKLFGGAKQYRTWSAGVDLGVTTGTLATGGVNKYYYNPIDFTWGVNVKDQLSHFLALQFTYQIGTVKGHNTPPDNSTGLSSQFTPVAFLDYKTKFQSAVLSGVANIGSVSFLHRSVFANFYATAGIGRTTYHPTGDIQTYNPATNVVTTVPYYYQIDATIPAKDIRSGQKLGDRHSVYEYETPIGVGVKFKITDAIDLDLGYNEVFLDGFNFTGNRNGYPSQRDHYSYGYAGLDYTFGPSSKPSLEWVNPIAMMYDELYDAALRQEVEALKARVGKVEDAVNDLKKDSDGDGVADQFDKCPNTPAGTVVDGSGCPIVFPKFSCDSCKTPAPAVQPYGNIQFDFDSSILKTTAYPVLDATSADLKKTGADAELDGFASSEGTAAHNMRLSRDRANSVKTYLVNSGVEAKKLKIKAYGETHPIADNSTEEGRIKNRRVEIKRK